MEKSDSSQEKTLAKIGLKVFNLNDRLDYIENVVANVLNDAIGPLLSEAAKENSEPEIKGQFYVILDLLERAENSIKRIEIHVNTLRRHI